MWPTPTFAVGTVEHVIKLPGHTCMMDASQRYDRLRVPDSNKPLPAQSNFHTRLPSWYRKLFPRPLRLGLVGQQFRREQAYCQQHREQGAG